MNRLRRQDGDSYPEDEGDDIDIIPLVDVMLLLLTFFIFVTMAMVVQEGVSVSLASAESGKSVKKKDPLVISIKNSGTYFLNKTKVSAEKLQSRLEQRFGNNSEQPVFINADKGADHEYVIRALDKVRQSGLSNVTFTIEPTQ